MYFNYNLGKTNYLFYFRMIFGIFTNCKFNLFNEDRC